MHRQNESSPPNVQLSRVEVEVVSVFKLIARFTSGNFIGGDFRFSSSFLLFLFSYAALGLDLGLYRLCILDILEPKYTRMQATDVESGSDDGFG